LWTVCGFLLRCLSLWIFYSHVLRSVARKVCTDCNRSCLFLSKLKWRSKSRPCFPVLLVMNASTSNMNPQRRNFSYDILYISFLALSIFRIRIHNELYLWSFDFLFLSSKIYSSYRQGWQKMHPRNRILESSDFSRETGIYWKGLYQQRSGWELICLALQLSFVHFLFLSRIIYFSNLKSQWRNFSFLFLSCIIYSSYRQGWQIMYPRNRIL